MWCLWSAKGGSGCSVATAALALQLAERRPVLLVDLGGGDLPAIVGVEPVASGLDQWLLANEPPPDAIARMECPVTDHLRLLPYDGLAPVGATPEPGHQAELWSESGLGERRRLLSHLLADDDRLVIVDLGDRGPGPGYPPNADPADPFLAMASTSTLVIRPCYLALRAARRLPPADDLIIIVEPNRALPIADVAAALATPIRAAVRWDPAIARAVDAGLLAQRLPRPLKRLVAAGRGHGE